MSESEPTEEASRRQYMLSKPRNVEFLGISVTETYLLVTWQPLYRGHELYLGLFAERRKPCSNAKEKFQAEQLQEDYQCAIRWRTNS